MISWSSSFSLTPEKISEKGGMSFWWAMCEFAVFLLNPWNCLYGDWWSPPISHPTAMLKKEVGRKEEKKTTIKGVAESLD